MNRRDFIRRSIGAVAAAAVPVSLVPAVASADKLSPLDMDDLVSETLGHFRKLSKAELNLLLIAYQIEKAGWGEL